MGAGIALEFSLRYPDMFKDYESKCKKGLFRTGKIDYFKSSDKIIINFPTKWHFKYPSKIEWIEQGLRDFVETYKINKVTSVAFPKLGTANGGLNWEDVKEQITSVLSELDNKIEIEIYEPYF
jgi:O-acetyl-ADP-ribose deacetylase (regulator of RNase III)